jgi:cellobiose phosphorylase
MKSSPTHEPVFPARISSPSGLSVEINSNGSIRRIDHGDIMINLFLGNEADGGPANIFLRQHGDTIRSIPMIGPQSPAAFEIDELGFSASGRWDHLVFKVKLVLAESAPAWFWHVEVENTGESDITCDLLLAQDLALAHYGAIRLNEYYVSQYVDHSPLHHDARGACVASRQNQSMGGRCPWTVTGSLRRGVSFATDAMQFHGLATRSGGTATALAGGLPGKRLQHEHSLAAIQDEPFTLRPGGKQHCGFFAWFLTDKPEATSETDAKWIGAALSLPEAACPQWPPNIQSGSQAASLFSNAPWLDALDLDDVEIRRFFGDDIRHEERENGVLLSFFHKNCHHVALKTKELKVLRPHGNLLRSGGSLVPDESALTSTAWMAGVFHSMVTQGHVSINRLLSTCHSYLGLFRSHGQRVFVETDGGWKLLGIPSAYEMTPGSCRWIYRHAGGVIEVVSTAPDDRHELGLTIFIIDGSPARFLISHHIAMNGDDGSASIPAVYEVDGNAIFVRAVPDSDVGRRFPDGGFRIAPAADTVVENISGDECLFADGVTRRQPFVCFTTAPSLAAGLKITGHLVEEQVAQNAGFRDSLVSHLEITAPAGALQSPAVGRISVMLPWFIQNALVHYLSPRGLEQYSGGGWGTRDVCQGPVELLLALGRFDVVRDLLLRVFRQQNADGDWPQWFMFFERERNIRPGDSHGDIVYWPVLALAQYLVATGDATVLDETLPFFHPDGDAAAQYVSVSTHVERALHVILTRVIPGSNLASYGHGDWNDSLQPVKADMRDRLCSAWTVTLNYQTFTTLADAYRRIGQSDRATHLAAMSNNILDEFKRVLIVDEVIAGFAYFHASGKTDFLLHPRDGITGLSYSLLPMVHAIINDMLTPRQAENHLSMIRKHLLGPDGAHLFDRPMVYRGGPQTYFQRAESASFFGREIGIMYQHAHLRYCEALARFGDAEAFFHALRQANPAGIREIVPSATLRQANCYYSSSDPAFADRYEAFEDYDKVNSGEIPLEGGWRVYSSGAGIAVRLLKQCFLGIRKTVSHLVLDPVIPSGLDGLKTVIQLSGRKIEVLYRIRSRGCGPLSVNLNGVDLDFVRESNAYRQGAVSIPMERILENLTDSSNRLTIWIG